MAPESMNEPNPSAFPVSKLAPFLRAMADPEGRGGLSPQQDAVIRRVEENLAERAATDDDA